MEARRRTDDDKLQVHSEDLANAVSVVFGSKRYGDNAMRAERPEHRHGLVPQACGGGGPTTLESVCKTGSLYRERHSLRQPADDAPVAGLFEQPMIQYGRRPNYRQGA